MSVSKISTNQNVVLLLCHAYIATQDKLSMVAMVTVFCVIEAGRKLSFISDLSMSIRVCRVLRGTTDLFIGLRLGGLGLIRGMRHSSCFLVQSFWQQKQTKIFRD